VTVGVVEMDGDVVVLGARDLTHPAHVIEVAVGGEDGHQPQVVFD